MLLVSTLLSHVDPPIIFGNRKDVEHKRGSRISQNGSPGITCQRDIFNHKGAVIIKIANNESIPGVKVLNR